MAKCGNCKGRHATANEVRACYAGQNPKTQSELYYDRDGNDYVAEVPTKAAKPLSIHFDFTDDREQDAAVQAAERAEDERVAQAKLAEAESNLWQDGCEREGCFKPVVPHAAHCREHFTYSDNARLLRAGQAALVVPNLVANGAQTDGAKNVRRVQTLTGVVAPATEKQIAFIRKLRAERGLDATDDDVESFTKREARNTIDGLLKLPVVKLNNSNVKHASAVPDGRYALRDADKVVKFYRVKAGRKAGVIFLDVQASDVYWPIKVCNERERILTAIAANLDAARALYSQELGRCYACGRTLTDETSRSLGIGPECRSK